MYYLPIVAPCPHFMASLHHQTHVGHQTFHPFSWAPVHHQHRTVLRDHGPHPYVVNIEEATLQNDKFRTALWTGEHLQLTLMSISVGESIGLEVHPKVDQFIRIEQGQGITEMGPCEDQVTFRRRVSDDDAIFVPAGYWHNLINTGNVPLKLYSIYAPPNHPFGTVHVTKEDAMESS